MTQRTKFRLGLLTAAVVVVTACSGGAATVAPTDAPTDAPSASAPAETTAPPPEPTLDELHQEALKEGGSIIWYAAMPPANAEKFIPLFEARFPGMKIEQVDQTAEDALARAVTEKRAGRVVADVFGSQFTVAAEAEKQGILLEYSPPEAADFADDFKSTHWTASDIQSLIVGWNTNLVPEANAPKTFDDLNNDFFKDGLIAEPDNYHILIALANHKFNGDRAAAEQFLRDLAAIGVQFHSGHSNLAELLTAGQAKACFGCYSHHFPGRIKDGAPINYSLEEGVANIVTTSITDGAPHPNSAKLFVRWSLSREGQLAYATAGRTPASPFIDPTKPVKAKNLMAVTPADLEAWPEAKALWMEIFGLR